MTTLSIDLEKLIQQAIPQVFGKSEQVTLQVFLHINRYSQIIEIDLAQLEPEIDSPLPISLNPDLVAQE